MISVALPLLSYFELFIFYQFFSSKQLLLFHFSKQRFFMTASNSNSINRISWLNIEKRKTSLMSRFHPVQASVIVNTCHAAKLQLNLLETWLSRLTPTELLKTGTNLAHFLSPLSIPEVESVKPTIPMYKRLKQSREKLYIKV